MPDTAGSSWSQPVPAGHSRFQLVTAGSSQLYNSPTAKSEPVSNAGGISRETQFKKKKMLHINVEWGKTRCKKQPCTRSEQKEGEEVLQTPEQGLLGSPWRGPHWSRGKVRRKEQQRGPVMD